MAVDISRQLYVILNGRDGETVALNIADAADKLSNTNIDLELATIRTGTYGYQIRRAIHDALYKLSLSEGGGGNAAFISGMALPLITGAIGAYPYIAGIVETED